MNAPSAFYHALIELAFDVLGIYIWIIVFGAVLSWLTAFNVVNHNSRFVQTVNDFVHRISEPLLKPIRRVLPPSRGFDFAPLVLILFLWFLQHFLANLMMGV